MALPAQEFAVGVIVYVAVPVVPDDNVSVWEIEVPQEAAHALPPVTLL